MHPPDGSIVVHGSFSYTIGNSSYNQIVKFDPSGAVVPDFITPLNSFEDSSIMAVDPDGKIVSRNIWIIRSSICRSDPIECERQYR